MSYIGKTPTSVPLTSSDIADGIITTTKIADDAATADKIANAVNSAISANTSKTTNATHSGEVTGSGALTIADNIVDEANLKVSNSPTNGYGLVARSGNTGGMTWEALGGGKILQVITSNDSSTRSTTSTSFVTASSLLSINITPSASSSKIFFIGSISLYQTNGNAFPEITIYRDSTDLSGGAGLGGFRAGDGNQNMVFTAISHLDSPSSTSQINYRIYIKSGSGDSVALQQNNNISTFTAFEIGA